MSEEAYEMTRSHSEASRSNSVYEGNEEEANLLNKEDQSDTDGEEEEVLQEDEEWAIVVDENAVDGVHEYDKVYPFVLSHCCSRLLFFLHY